VISGENIFLNKSRIVVIVMISVVVVVIAHDGYVIGDGSK